MTWWPGWDSIDSAGAWSHFWFWAGIFCLFALGGAEVISHIYGLRKDELVAAAESTATKQRNEDADAAEQRRKTEVEGLQKQLTEADKKAATALQQQAQRVLSDSQRTTLIAALSPFRGQKISFLTILGDAESKRFLEDFLAVFDAAGWDRSANDAIIFGNFGLAADPIGVMVLINAPLLAQKMAPKASLPLVQTLSGFMHITVAPSNDVLPDGVRLVVGRKEAPP